MKYDRLDKSTGFSLIELIVVIVILSILATFGVRFIVTSTQNYEQTRTRALLVNTGRQALEQMTRRLRGALPYSVRLTNSDACIQFLPVAGGGTYLTPVPDHANGALGSETIAVAPHMAEFGTARWVSIGALAAAELYGPGGSLQGLSAHSTNQLALTGSKIWLRNSINRRFYLVDNPQAFCVVNNQLRFYSDQSIAAGAVDLTAPSVLMANHVVSTAPFALTQGSENRNTLVLIQLAVLSGSESLDFQQQVMIRNVP
jgi:MSHA biogenesis protein MshO